MRRKQEALQKLHVDRTRLVPFPKPKTALKREFRKHCGAELLTANPSGGDWPNGCHNLSFGNHVSYDESACRYGVRASVGPRLFESNDGRKRERIFQKLVFQKLRSPLLPLILVKLKLVTPLFPILHTHTNTLCRKILARRKLINRREPQQSRPRGGN